MNTSARTLRSNGGYSLLELMTILVVIGILVSLAAPAMGAFVDSTRTRAAINELSSDVALARVMAVREGRFVRLNVVSSSAYAVETQAADGTWETLKTVDITNEHPALRISDGGLTTVEFNPRGTVASGWDGDRSIEITLGESSESISVSGAGRVYRGN